MTAQTLTDWNANRCAHAKIVKHNHQVVTPNPIITVQAKLQEVIEAGIKLNYESLVEVLNGHPWEESQEPFENIDKYECDEYITNHDDEYDETLEKGKKKAERT